MTMPAPTNTVRLHRVLRAPPERVYKAFLDADAMVKWLPPHGFTGKVQSMDVRVGGGFKMSFTNFGRWPRLKAALTTRLPTCPVAPQAMILSAGCIDVSSFAADELTAQSPRIIAASRF
jgi:Activator of Hsp90 ATPase homolog 1-like protein